MPTSFLSERSLLDRIRQGNAALKALEVRNIASNISAVAPNIDNQYQGTSFANVGSNGDKRIVAVGGGTAIDEETNAAVLACATFEDVGGNGAAITSPFSGSRLSVPLKEQEAKTAYYHSHPNFFRWAGIHPSLNNLKTYIASNAFVLNLTTPAVAEDADNYIYYESHADFNVSANRTYAIWFYPLSFTPGSGTYRVIHYRYIDASNYYMILYKPSDKEIYAFINEAGTLTKQNTNGVLVQDTWNLIIWSYDPTANTMIITLNNVISNSTHTDTLSPPYTASTRMFVGGIPTANDWRLTGYLGGTFTMWNIILSTTQKTNFWQRGTIVTT